MHCFLPIFDVHSDIAYIHGRHLHSIFFPVTGMLHHIYTGEETYTFTM